MHFILLSVACSVLVSVLLKLAPRRGWDVAQMVTWNYLAAALLCAWLLQPPAAALSQPGAPWAELLALAFVLPTLFLVLAAAVRHAGIVRTDIAQRLSLLLSLAAAFLFFGERAGTMKLAGLALGLVAVVGILARPVQGQADRRGWLLLLAVWAGFALVDVMLKRLALSGTPATAALLVAFVLAFAGMLAWQGWRRIRHGVRPGLRHIGAGLLLGVLNFGNIVFYVRAHQALPDSPAVVFATMNIGVVLLGTAVGVLGFGERTSRLNRVAIVLAVVAISLIALAPR
ncbi:EamA family transporter [Pseudoxanthomonas suwonensis]|uniref:Membrane protein n=1 Tax=Pseudoxanthomonas suwonensis TaxID=314722 RepID=A0A0E3Z1F6_9GAMM|nr:EamA family transporter [Pseudoxanthomonas suwonensis]AKC86663.1 membrane protein [Pseudoxanthomonas suwonensis]